MARISKWITCAFRDGTGSLIASIIFLGLGASSLQCAEQVFADQIAALRSLPDMRLQWAEKDDKGVQRKQSFISKGKFFQFNTGFAEIRAYCPRGFQLLRTNDGLMMIEKDPVAGKPSTMKRGLRVPAVLYPLRFLGMEEGDLGDVGLAWSDLFNQQRLDAQIASVVKKTMADDRGGWWATVPYKTPGTKNGQGVFDHHGAYLRVHIEPVAACRQAKLVTRIEYTHETEGLASAYEFTYDLVTAANGQQFPLVKSGRWISPDGKTVHETLERIGVELGKDIPEDEIAIDPVLAKQIKDVTSGLLFQPDQ